MEALTTTSRADGLPQPTDSRELSVGSGPYLRYLEYDMHGAPHSIWSRPFRCECLCFAAKALPLGQELPYSLLSGGAGLPHPGQSAELGWSDLSGRGSNGSGHQFSCFASPSLPSSHLLARGALSLHFLSTLSSHRLFPQLSLTHPSPQTLLRLLLSPLALRPNYHTCVPLPGLLNPFFSTSRRSV
jgi:hypothetical protein